MNKLALSFNANIKTQDKESKEDKNQNNIKLYEDNILSFINQILSLFTEGKIEQKNKYEYIKALPDFKSFSYSFPKLSVFLGKSQGGRWSELLSLSIESEIFFIIVTK